MLLLRIYKKCEIFKKASLWGFYFPILNRQFKYFVYNENNKVIGEYDNSGNVINEYVYFGLRPVAVKNNGNLNIVHTDYLGTPRVVTSGLNGGNMLWQWKNDNPYGYNSANGSIEFNLRFAGQYYDSESGLHYNRFRTYNPELGRYMQSDPIGLAGGFNTYNYVDCNPMNGVDSLGLWWSKVNKIHQSAGEKVFGKLITANQLKLINAAQEWTDNSSHQTPEFDFLHAMRMPNESICVAYIKSNMMLNLLANNMIELKKQNDDRAYFLFGIALHIMQDSTSPVHSGFQEWGNRPWYDIWTAPIHAFQEGINPGRNSELDLITKKAWNGFLNNDISVFEIK